MMSASGISARAAAMRALMEFDQTGRDIADAFGELAETVDRRSQATDLACGAMRNLTLLDNLLKRLGGLDKKKTPAPLWTLLRLGVYELVFAPQTAEYAIVNEYVKLAEPLGKKKAQGFVNAVLRAVQRAIAQRDLAAQEQPAVFSPTCCIVRADGSRCVFRQAVLPDPAQNRPQYLHTLWSLPLWLIEAWDSAYGPSQTETLCRASNRHPTVYAWPNTLRIDAPALAEKLTQEGVVCRVCPRRHVVAIRAGRPISQLAAFQEGLFYIQDLSSRAAVELLKPRAGQTYVDVCGAPGGKAIALALLMEDKGRILLSDIDARRLEKARENIARLGLGSIECAPAAQIETELRRLKQCDGVIVDVPCSNTGVLARRIEARWRQSPEKIQTLRQHQKDLLKKFADGLKPNVRLLYSTCSLLAEENERQIQQFLLDNPQFYLLAQKTTLASVDSGDGFDCDGGYAAIVLMR